MGGLYDRWRRVGWRAFTLSEGLVLIALPLISFSFSFSHPSTQLKEPLGISNKHVGYTYLVDQNLKIRWAGCGFAERSENEGLRRALGVLMGRWQEQKGKQTGGSI
jgi:hypothetical protein